MLASVACGQSQGAQSEDQHGPPPSEPAYGGALVTIEDHVLELVVHETGETHLHPHTGDLSEASATVALPGADTTHAIALHWEDGVQGFVGRLETEAPTAGTASILLVHEDRRLESDVEIARLLPAPEHDGSVVHVGEHDVEVTVDPEGHVSAWVLDDPEHRLDIDLVLNLPGDDGRLHPLSLAWDPELAAYVGELEGLHPEPGPLELLSREHGEDRVGHGTLLGVVERSGSGEDVDVPDDLQLELPELGGQLPAVIPVPDASSSDEPSSDEPSSSEGEAPAPE